MAVVQPYWTVCRSMAGSKTSHLRPRQSTGTRALMYTAQHRQHKASLATVDRAAPSTPQPMTATQNRSPRMLSRALSIKKYSALLLSPKARRVAARKL